MKNQTLDVERLRGLLLEFENLCLNTSLLHGERFSLNDAYKINGFCKRVRSAIEATDPFHLEDDEVKP